MKLTLLSVPETRRREHAQDQMLLQGQAGSELLSTGLINRELTRNLVVIMGGWSRSQTAGDEEARKRKWNSGSFLEHSCFYLALLKMVLHFQLPRKSP